MAHPLMQRVELAVAPVHRVPPPAAPHLHAEHLAVEARVRLPSRPRPKAARGAAPRDPPPAQLGDTWPTLPAAVQAQRPNPGSRLPGGQRSRAGPHYPGRGPLAPPHPAGALTMWPFSVLCLGSSASGPTDGM